MAESADARQFELGTVDDRYRLVAEQGRGGLAVVYRAFDSVTGRTLALKRLQARKDAKERRRSLELFEREFHTLAQLAHPRIIQVYDYAVDGEGPYYTMELLDGGDLQAMLPVDWRRACAVARDVCSALSLLHSRRMVHRDVSARNVRCTSDGLAKLIDFGAMVPMGPNKHAVVGTPPYTAPEVMQLMLLDARTDLFALGATLFYALVGRHAYPAKSFVDLVERWSHAPPSPSTFVPGIPPALDTLVLDLLQTNPAARPANAAEVIERLSAIDGETRGEEALIAQAYLSTPLLVGREAYLERVRGKTQRALQGNGSALLIEGASGIGRSRFLDAAALDAKLEGAVVLRADAADANAGDYGALRALARGALMSLPSIAAEAAAPKLTLLSRVLPELVEHVGSSLHPPPEGVQAMRAEVQPALRGWLCALSAHKPLFIAIDDIDRIDEPSAASIALLSHDLSERAMVVVATLENRAAAASVPAMKLFSDNATPIVLDSLSPEDTEKLLASVFGEVPNLGLVANRVHGVSGGNPRDTMRLAQHLLDRGVVRYDAGAWTLPAQFDAADLPANMAQALADRVHGLSPNGRALARAVSLCPGLSATFAECLSLSGHGLSGPLMESLDELTRTEIFRRVGARYELAQRAWAPALAEGMDESQGCELHLRLARLFELREDEQFRWGQHLILGGEPARGIEVLARQSEALEDEARRDPERFLKFIRSLPADWFETYDRAIRLCDQIGRPKKEKFLLRSRIAAVASVGGTTDRVHLSALITELCEQSGLDDWVKLEGLEPMPRVMTAIGKARDRYAESPEHERVLDPGTAIRQLARALIQISAVLTSALDIAGAKKLPSLAPFVPLSPAVGVIEWMIKGMTARMTGRTEQAQAAYAEVLKRTAEPDRAGLDESHHTNMRLGLMSGLGMIEAAKGQKSSLDWARELETEPLYQVNAVHVRMLYLLWQGDTREAARCKHQVELLRIQNSARQFFEGTHLIWQITAYAAACDLTRTKQTIDEIDLLCRRYPGWLPVRHYGLGEYHRIRGDLGQALSELEAGLLLVQAGEHQIWPSLAGAQLSTLHELGQNQRASELGHAYVAAAERAEVGYLKNYILMPLSLIEASLGHEAQAVETAERVLGDFRALGTTGLNLALAHEMRARVAIILRDRPLIEQHAALLKGTFNAASSPALAAKFEKLTREAQGDTDVVSAELIERLDSSEWLATSRALSMLESCHGAAERAECALSWLIQSSGVTEGYLFLLSAEGLTCVAKLGEQTVPQSVREAAEQHLTAQLSDVQTMTKSSWAFAPDHELEAGENAGAPEYLPVLLSHPAEQGTAITGVAVLVVPADKRFSYPTRLAAELSKRIERVGDVSRMIVTG